MVDVLSWVSESLDAADICDAIGWQLLVVIMAPIAAVFCAPHRSWRQHAHQMRPYCVPQHKMPAAGLQLLDVIERRPPHRNPDSRKNSMRPEISGDSVTSASGSQQCQNTEMVPTPDKPNSKVGEGPDLGMASVPGAARPTILFDPGSKGVTARVTLGLIGFAYQIVKHQGII